MKISKFINFAVIALMLFAFTLTAAFYSSPPTRAEKVQVVQTAQTVTGDIPISTIFRENRKVGNTGNFRFTRTSNFEAARNRRTEIKSLLTVISEVRNRPPEKFDFAEGNFTDIANTRFNGIGGENFARAKV